MKSMTKAFAVALLALAAFRVAIMAWTPLFEPSETRYAAISANMARCGDWFAPSFTYKGKYEIFAGKPPLVFQACGAACRTLGVNEFAVRLFPFASFAALLWLVWYSARRGGARREEALLATAVCASCTALYATAGFCMTDMPLVCCVSGALLLYAADGARSLWSALAICALLAAGMLVKGPVAVALFGLCVAVDFVFERVRTGRWPRIPALNLAAGAALFAAICVPYFALVEQRQPGFLRYFFINENLMRFLVHDYGDKYGAGRESFRGMAAIWALLVTLPWSLAPVVSLAKERRTLLKESFALRSVCVIALFWCLTSRVPPTYLLPVVPLFALHLATVWTRARDGRAALLWKALPYAAAISALALGGTLLATRITKPRKLPGAAAPQKISDHYFSHEFYHGPWGEGNPFQAANERTPQQP